MNVSELEQAFEAGQAGYVADWLAAVRFPSVGADPARLADCRACAAWFADRLAARGFAADLVETGGPPAVLAVRPGAAGKPRVLIYGHYDVQPADPFGAWTSPPFEPVLRDGRVWGRGAQDNKGQLAYVLAALDALHRRAGGDLPPITVLLEGQEESGSHGLTRVLPSLAARLQADVLLVMDTFMGETGAPALVMGLRGIVHLTVTLRGPARDLHSGVHGGLAPNPAAGLCRLMAGLHRPDGGVAVRGFEVGPDLPSARERELLARAPFDAAAYERRAGVPPTGGESGVPPLVRLGFRPTIEVNGIHGGYGGAGSKTIIPAEATAKLTARLAAGQDPAACLAALEDHLRAHTPAGLRCEISDATVGGPALRLAADSPWAGRAAAVLREVVGRPPEYQWEGASIPILTLLAKVAGGAAPLLVGFGLEEDAVHAPNESFALARFRLGFLFTARFLGGL